MRQYSFTTNWQFKAPLEKVWQIIYESEQWADWWKDVESVVELEKGDENGIGSIRKYTLKSPTGYKLSFNLLLTERKDFELLKGNAIGDLVGTGAWYFQEKGDLTIVRCEWRVATTKKWMNTFAFILAPIFSFNHKWVMRHGKKSLTKKLKSIA